VLARSAVSGFPLLETLGAEHVPEETIRNRRAPSIVLRVTLVGKRSGREISACALLDSGAEGIIVDDGFVRANGLMLRTLVRPLPVRNVDGSPNKMGSVKHTTIQRLQIRTADDAYHDETVEFYVTTLGEHDIILGTDWLRAHNPEINWAEPRLAFTRCPDTCTLSTKPVVISS